MIKHWKIIAPILAIILATAAVAYYKFPDIFGHRSSITILADTSGGSLQSYLNLAQSLNPRGNIATTSATFLAVGDIMLSRNVALAAQKSNDIDLPFRGMADVLNPPAGGPDFNFGNLESPVAPNKPVIGGTSLVFGAASSTLKSLKDYNFKILNLANNHAFDQGLAGVDVTRSALDSLDIAHEGTGDNLDQAWTPAIVTENGIKICFLGASFASINDSGAVTNNYVARIGNTARLQAAVTTSKSECDFTVVTMHAGTEYTRAPNQAQITFARAAIDDGADIVIGSHPHWIQTVEKYRGKYIFYSLGNFIFDQAWSQDTMEGLTLKIEVSKNTGSNPAAPGAAGLDDLQGSRIPAKIDSIELIPVIITDSRPRPATSEESKKILQKIGQNTNTLAP